MQGNFSQVIFARTKRAFRRNLRGLAPPFLVKLFNRGKRRDRGPFMTLTKDGNPFPVTTSPLRFQFFSGRPLIEVPISKMIYSGGIRYTEDEHPFVRYFSHGTQALDSYYGNFQPKDICERHFLPAAQNPEAVVTTTPWIEVADDMVVTELRGEHGLPKEHGTKLYGPVSEEKKLLEADKLDRLKKSFDRDGLNYNGRYLQGYFIIDNDGEWAVAVTDGQHRLAVMAAMGYKTAIFRLKPLPQQVIHERDVEHFPMVRLGLLTKSEASAIVRSYTQPFDKPGLFAPLRASGSTL